MFKTLKNINHDLLAMFEEIETYFSIKLNLTVIDKIFRDAEEDQVSQKEYLIYEGKQRLLKKPMRIRGTVEEYEPSEIWIVIENIDGKAIKHFAARACE
jgi:hypothetical protein